MILNIRTVITLIGAAIAIAGYIITLENKVDNLENKVSNFNIKVDEMSNITPKEYQFDLECKTIQRAQSKRVDCEESYVLVACSISEDGKSVNHSIDLQEHHCISNNKSAWSEARCCQIIQSYTRYP